MARQAYFSGIINENKNNAKVLFSTIDHLLNPPQAYKQTIPASKAKCNEFASFFNNKMFNIRADILKNASNSQVSYVISFNFSGDGEIYTFSETSEYSKSENP